MSVIYKNGAIVYADAFHKKALYDISNNLLTAQFDGTGAIAKYAVINKWDFIECYYSQLAFNGKVFDIYTPKTVTMAGRMQITETETEDARLRITQFADDKTNALFEEYEVTAKKDVVFEKVVNFGLNITSWMKNFFSTRFTFRNLMRLIFGTLGSEIKGHRKNEKREGFTVIRNTVIENFYFDFAVSNPCEPLETNHLYTNQFAAKLEVKAGETRKMRIVLSAGTGKDFSYVDVAECYGNFDAHKASAEKYIAELPCPESCKGDAFLEAYFKSLYNCSLTMYKEVGRFRGFLAGIVYQSPARTYFRDGYWTVLSVLPYRPDLVRNEIITLATGIDKDGKCPSAVKYNFKNWWGNHYDSPSCFAAMLYDYVRASGDTSILDEPWRGGTILDAAVKVVDKLAEYADDTGLLYKGGEYNRRDWCDNVFRSGYCTYDEAFYARALKALSVLLEERDNAAAEAYAAKYEKVCKAINDILWDSKLGYYVNYKNETFTEDNLSIDTVTTVLFGIAPEDRARSVLKKMESMLETRNNKDQKAGDFGVLSVYPFYKDNRSVVLKSSLPYYYHNGGDWPYWSAAYAYAKLMYGMDYIYPLTRWFEYNIAKNNFTPVEFYAPPHADGSLLQAWSSVGAFVLSYPDGRFFG